MGPKNIVIPRSVAEALGNYISDPGIYFHYIVEHFFRGMTIDEIDEDGKLGNPGFAMIQMMIDLIERESYRA